MAEVEAEELDRNQILKHLVCHTNGNLDTKEPRILSLNLFDS